MPSVYELMPIYKAIKIGDDWKRVAEIERLPETIQKDRAADALGFHREIRVPLTAIRAIWIT